MNKEEIFTTVVREVDDYLKTCGKTFKVFHRDGMVDIQITFSDKVRCGVMMRIGDDDFPESEMTIEVTGQNDEQILSEPYSYEEYYVGPGLLNDIMKELFLCAERYDDFLRGCEEILMNLKRFCDEHKVDMGEVVTIENLDICVR